MLWLPVMIQVFSTGHRSVLLYKWLFSALTVSVVAVQLLMHPHCTHTKTHWCRHTWGYMFHTPIFRDTQDSPHTCRHAQQDDHARQEPNMETEYITTAWEGWILLFICLNTTLILSCFSIMSHLALFFIHHSLFFNACILYDKRHTSPRYGLSMRWLHMQETCIQQ